MMKIIFGGTFDLIHKGHESLIKKAFKLAGKNGSVSVGLSDGKLVESKKNVKSFKKRKKNLIEFIEEENYDSSYKIFRITDIYGPTLEGDFDIIVVSEETYKNAKKINKIREKNNKKPIKIVKIPYFLAEDGKPISTTRIKNKEIDLNGNKL